MLTRHKLAGGVATTALFLAMTSGAFAQETTSAIRGEVTDSGGAPVADAQVSIVHQPSGTTSQVETDESGTFDARGLRVGGPYVITIQAPGFEPETLSGLSLTLAETTRLNFDLAAEGEVEAVTITARRDPTADNTGVSFTQDQEDVDEVVSITRDFRDIARRSILTSQNTRGDQGISIAGSNPRTNRITIDGAQAQDEFGLNTGGTPTRRGPLSLEAIEQFTVEAVPTDVENGNFLGGAINVVLRSGENDFEGSLFVNYLNDGLVGDSVRGRPLQTQITQESYGAFLSGPIIRDKLFFALSYEFYESATATATGPTGAGFANSIRGITQTDVDNFVTLFSDVYATDFDPGSILRSTPIVDEKYTAKIDWNITDSQRASFTARYALSEEFSRTGLGTGSAGLSSQYYLTGEEDYSYAAELNSDWTGQFSTQIRFTYRDAERRQQPEAGQEFAQITVCSAPTSVVGSGNTTIGCGPTSVFTFGPDAFRQANFLETSNAALFIRGTYSLGDHLFKFGYEGRKQDIFNIFVPRSDGVYYFDSIADFRNGRASRLEYNNAITGVDTDAAAAFDFFTHSLFAQDTFEVSDVLRFTAGARFDFYTSEDEPAFNQNFVNRNGFTNQETFDGEGVFMPRFSFEYEPTSWFDLRGGFGLFSGGLPNVVLSNSFSNTGVLSAGVNIQRRADGTFEETTRTPGFTQAIGAAALNINVADPRFGFDIPAAIQAFQGGAVVSPAAETNAISPGFTVPSEYKFFTTATFQAEDGWADGFAPTWAQPVLEGWRLNLDGVVTRVNQGLLFRDLRATPLVVNGQQQFTPDGRIRYNGLSGSPTNPGFNRDIVTLNTDFGESYTLALSLQREFDNGFDVLLGYARQDIEDQTSGARFASTASSLYGLGPAGLDPNEEAEGTSFEEIKNRFKAEVGYSARLLGGLGGRFADLRTRLNLFGEVRSGRPVSFVMGEVGSGRGPVYGVNRGNHLLYVPDFNADTNPNDLNVGFVTFEDRNTLNDFRNAVNFFGLPQGRILEKGEGSDDQPEVYQLDFQLSQELPGILPTHRTRLVFDLQNVLNLLNDEWGLVEEFSDTNRLISVRCADANGTPAASGNPVCARYFYTDFEPGALTKNIDVNGRSVWALQIRLKYEF